MKFILQFDQWSWCENNCVSHFNAIDVITITDSMLPPEVLLFENTSVFSLSFTMVVGILLGCLLTILWKKSHRQNSTKTHSPQANTPNNTNQLIASRIIYSAVKDLINSQYVLKDRKQYKSLLQTPLRTSIEQLRLVADSLVDNTQTTATIKAWPSHSISPQFIKYKSNSLCCDALYTINEQINFIESTRILVCFQHDHDSADTPILPVCPSWFGGVIRELLLNAIKHNQQHKTVKIEVRTSVHDGNFVMCVTDNGVGLSSKITNKLDAIKIANFSDIASSILVSEEPTNLANIKRQLFQLSGSLEVVSARQFMTKIMLNIPLSSETEQANLRVINGLRQTESTDDPNIPIVLLVSQHNFAPFGSLHELAERFNMIYANSVEQAFESIKLTKPDCVVFDNEVGKLSAVYMQRWLAQNTEFTNLPMVMLENQSKVASQIQVLQSGVSAVIDKSANAVDIVFVIEKVMKEKKRVLEQVSEGIANYHLNQASAKNINDHDDKKFVTRFTLVLKQNFRNERFNRPEAAKLMLMTEKTLARRLHQHYELGFTEKLRQYKLHQAKLQLLRGTKVTTAAYDCGFSSPSYFAQCFRAEFGFAPSMLSKTQ